MLKPRDYWSDGGLRIEGRNPLEDLYGHEEEETNEDEEEDLEL